MKFHVKLGEGEDNYKLSGAWSTHQCCFKLYGEKCLGFLR